MFRAIELAGNQLAIPTQDGVRLRYGGNRLEWLAPESLSDFCKMRIGHWNSRLSSTERRSTRRMQYSRTPINAPSIHDAYPRKDPRVPKFRRLHVCSQISNSEVCAPAQAALPQSKDRAIPFIHRELKNRLRVKSQMISSSLRVPAHSFELMGCQAPG